MACPVVVADYSALYYVVDDETCLTFGRVAYLDAAHDFACSSLVEFVGDFQVCCFPVGADHEPCLLTADCGANLAAKILANESQGQHD